MSRSLAPILLLLAAIGIGAFVFWPSSDNTPLESNSATQEQLDEGTQEAQVGKPTDSASQDESRERQEAKPSPSAATGSALLAAIEAGGEASIRAVDANGALVSPAKFLARERGGKIVWLDAPRGKLNLDRLNRIEAIAALANGNWSSPIAVAGTIARKSLDLRTDQAAAQLTVRVSLKGSGAEPQATCLYRRLPPGTSPDITEVFTAGLVSEDMEEWEAFVDESGTGEDPTLFADAFETHNPADPNAQVSQGELVLQELPPGLMKLDLSSPLGVPTSEVVDLKPGAQEVVEVQLVEGGWIEGRVLDVDRNGFAQAMVGALALDAGFAEFVGARVLTRQLENEFLPPGQGGVTDQSGAFRFGPIKPGRHLVIAYADGMLPARLDDAHVIAGSTTRLDSAVLRSGHTIAALVRSQLNGEVIDNATVSWKSGEGGIVEEFTDWNQSDLGQDEAGRYLLDNLPFEPIRIRVEAEGFAPQEQDFLIEASMWFVDSSPSQLEFNLMPGHRLAGRVLDAKGQPAVDTDVAVLEGSTDSNPFALLAGIQGDNLPSTKTDEAGAFLFEDLAPGEYRVVARNDIDAPAMSDVIDLEAVPSARVELQLAPAGTVRVEYTPAEGSAISGAVVNLVHTSLSIPMMRTTDEEGVAEFPALPAGDYNLNVLPAEALGQADLTSNIDVSMQFFALAEGERKVVQIGAADDTASLTGHFTLKGQPVSDVTVTLLAGGSVKTRKTDENGSFSIEGLPVGTLSWFVSQGQSPAHAGNITLEAGDNELREEMPGGSLEVTVRSATDGSPAVGVPVTAATADSSLGNPLMAMTDTDGIARFELMQEGVYRVAAGTAAMPLFGGGTGLGSKTIDVQVPRGPAQATINLEEGATFRIRALDPNGAAVAGASMFYLSEDGRPISGLSMTGSNSKGVAQLEGLPAGPGRILVKHATAGQSEFAVNLTAGQLDKREVQLQPGVTLLLTVRGEGGEQLPGMMAVLRDDRGARISMTFSMQDAQAFNQAYFTGSEQKLGPVAPGKYTLELFRLGGTVVEQSIEIPEGVTELRRTVTYRP